MDPGTEPWRQTRRFACSQFTEVTESRWGRQVYGQVKNYISENDRCQLPKSLMCKLLSPNGAHVYIQEICPPVATVIMLKPSSDNFPQCLFTPGIFYLRVLKHFACVSLGETLYFKLDGSQHEVTVVQTRPGPIVRVHKKMQIGFESLPNEGSANTMNYSSIEFFDFPIGYNNSSNTSSSESASSSSGSTIYSSESGDSSSEPDNSQWAPPEYSRVYCAYSMKMLTVADSPPDAELGNKIVLPVDYLRGLLANGDATYPMVFKLVNRCTSRQTNCGVSNFSAHPGACHLPEWMMRTLGLKQGDKLHIRTDWDLPKGTFAKVQPQSAAFMGLSDKKDILERCLRNFTCLSADDTIVIQYEDNMKEELRILETQPGRSILIVNCDLAVDVVPPAGYQTAPPAPTCEEQEAIDFAQPEVVIDESQNVRKYPQRGIPDFRWKLNTLKMIRSRPVE